MIDCAARDNCWRRGLALLLLWLAGCRESTQTAMPLPLRIEPAAIELAWETGEDVDTARVATCQLTNPGPLPIQILSVQGSCSCTVAEPLERTTLPVGESVELRLRVTAPRIGKKSSVVRIVTAPPSSAAELHLTAAGPPTQVPSYIRYPASSDLVVTVAGESGEASL